MRHIYSADSTRGAARSRGPRELGVSCGGAQEKDASLAETPATFNKSGALLRVLVGKAKDRAARIGFDNKVTVTGDKITAVPVSPYTANKQAWDV